MRDTSAFVVKLFTLVLILICSGQTVHAQLSELEAREMLVEKGISEDTLRARLLKKGIDPDNIKPTEIDKFQEIVMLTIHEIEMSRIEAAPGQKTEPAKRDTSKTRLMTDKPRTEGKPVVPQAVTPPAESSIYGQHLFKSNAGTIYVKAADGIVPESYILDTGDKIGVIGFGRSQFEEILVIAEDGFIQPDERLPKILLRGVKWSAAKEILFQRYNLYYEITKGQFQATLIQPRNMTVHVLGEAMNTGAFTLPGINTAINVISAAGGPTAIGSVRNIKIIRGGLTRTLDMYEFMSDPSVADNYYLQNSDYIHIPVAEKIVTIQGAVVRPMKYELKEKENLIRLIEFAGGTTPQAYLSDVQVTRYLDDRRVVTNVNLRELAAQGGDYILLNGDVITLKQIDQTETDYVEVKGAVMFPGKYESTAGIRVSDLLAQASLKPSARLDFAYVLRYNPDATFRYERISLANILQNPAHPDNLVLNNRDKIQVMDQKLFAYTNYFTVLGAVKDPDSFYFNASDRLLLEDALLIAGGVLQDAAEIGYVMRQDPAEPKQVTILDVNIREALSNPASSSNIEILPGDRIQVLDKGSRRDDQFVIIFGSVRKPGKYTYGDGLSLADLIDMAGGLNVEADRSRIDISRSQIIPNQPVRITQQTYALPPADELIQGETPALQPYDHVYVRTIPEFEWQQSVRIEGEIKYPGAYPLLQTGERIGDLVRKAGGLTTEAFPEGAKLIRQSDSIGLVVINLDEILRNERAPSNVTLVAGDIITIPKSKDLVTIEGFINLDEIYAPTFLNGEKAISVAFRGEKSAKYYVDHFAAGVSRQGSSGDIKVQFADGRVENTRKFLFFNTYPKVERGANILVGQKKEKPEVVKGEEKTDWGTVVRDTMAQATAVLTILILVDQLSK